MNRRFRAIAALLIPLVHATDARAEDRAPPALRRAVEAGQLVPLGDILDRLLPRMAGSTYIGAEFDLPSLRYRLKFIRSRQVVWVDVDARSGRILGRFPP